MFFLLSRFFFLFKQKTAYEMRISDWSSDVCSSDLLDLLVKRRRRRLVGLQVFQRPARLPQGPLHGIDRCQCRRHAGQFALGPAGKSLPGAPESEQQQGDVGAAAVLQGKTGLRRPGPAVKCQGKTPETAIGRGLIAVFRSEEHTSELQSLMRI